MKENVCVSGAGYRNNSWYQIALGGNLATALRVSAIIYIKDHAQLSFIFKRFTGKKKLYVYSFFKELAPRQMQWYRLIYITCSWQVFIIPILQSPHDVALIFRTVSFTLPGKFCMRMEAVSTQQPGMGNCTGRADKTQENTKQEDLLIQKYCIPAKISYVLKVAKSLPVEVSEATVKPLQSVLFHCVLGTTSYHKESFPPWVPSWLLQPQLSP